MHLRSTKKVVKFHLPKANALILPWIQTHSSEILKEMESHVFGSFVKDVKEGKKLISSIFEKKQIVGVVYNPRFLSTDASLVGSTKKDKKRHASTIVAQKVVNQELKYWIRNSWGDDSCEKSLHEQEHPRFTCDQGYDVVSADEFLKNSSVIEYFD